jgi:S1-C subfamily serine protease
VYHAEPDDTERLLPAVRPPRRHTGIALPLLIAVVLALVIALGVGLTRGRSAASVGSGVVVIETNLAYQGAQAAGTGMVLTPSGEVLTNNHVIRGATTINVVLPGTGRRYRAKVVGYDVTDDVAVLQAAGAANLRTVSLGSATGLQAGEKVLALGNAGGTGRFTSAPGTVTGVGRSITVGDDQGGSEHLRGMIETNAAVRPGDSGGPLFDSSGQVVGMNTAASASNDVAMTASQGFAIPIDRAMSIARQIDSGQGSATIHVGDTAFLGVEAAADSYRAGAVVASVVPGSPAEAAGFAAGDLITSVGGRSIASPEELSAIVSTRSPGDAVSAVYLDANGMTQTANLKLGSGPPR